MMAVIDSSESTKFVDDDHIQCRSLLWWTRAMFTFICDKRVIHCVNIVLNYDENLNYGDWQGYFDGRISLT